MVNLNKKSELLVGFNAVHFSHSLGVIQSILSLDKADDRLESISFHGWLGTNDVSIDNPQLTIVANKTNYFLFRLVYDGQFHCGGSLLTQDYVLTVS